MQGKLCPFRFYFFYVYIVIFFLHRLLYLLSCWCSSKNQRLWWWQHTSQSKLCLHFLTTYCDIILTTPPSYRYSEEYKDISWFFDALTWLVKDNAQKHHSLIVGMLSTLVAVREPGSLNCAQDLALLSLSVSESFCSQVDLIWDWPIYVHKSHTQRII